jgi:RimJ/RimL family protein N-acetyltransferase
MNQDDSERDLRNRITLRRMTLADVPAIVEIHCSSWPPSEISVKLGPRFVERFYSAIAESSHAFTYLVEKEGRIVAYSSGFLRYRNFNRSFVRSNLLFMAWIVLHQLLAGRFSIADLFNMVTDSRKQRKLRFPDVHWGMAALANEYKGTSLGKGSFSMAVQAVFRDLKKAGQPGVWGPCDSKNIAMERWLIGLGFERVDRIRCFGRDILVFEKVFDDKETS